MANRRDSYLSNDEIANALMKDGRECVLRIQRGDDGPYGEAETQEIDLVGQTIVLCRLPLLAVVYKLRALDCGRELPGIEPSSVIPLTVNNLEAKSAYRSRRFYPALMYDLDMRVALTPLSGPVPHAGVGVSAQ
jgi:hypothetical protein